MRTAADKFLIILCHAQQQGDNAVTVDLHTYLFYRSGGAHKVQLKVVFLILSIIWDLHYVLIPM